MVPLPNGCYCSQLKIHPKNWQQKTASIKADWYIYYRFYDPAFKSNPKYQKGKLVVLKGMNHFKTVPGRQDQTKLIWETEEGKLKSGLYNPIKGVSTPTTLVIEEIPTYTPFITALYQVEKRIPGAGSTKRDLKSILRYVENAAIHLKYAELPINAISRKHIKQILSHIDVTNRESAHRYNKIRSYLMILYKELVEMEVVEINPLRDISKKKCTQKLRKLPSDTDRKIIDQYLKENNYRFWLFVHIFFHSGARLTEMMNVKRKDIDLDKQSFIITIKKGTSYKEVRKPIKDIALPYWEEAITSAVADDFIFSKDLLPGDKPIQSYQITKRWNRHVKKKLGIAEDFYSLKHLNLDETAALLDIHAAAAMASHTSTAVTLKHYAVNELQRQNERLKHVKNSFS